jgi:uncharacterized protein (TIGR02266 family)
MALFCPFCSEEIAPEMNDCPSCGYAYDAETLKFFRSVYDVASEEYLDDRRRQIRITKKFKVSYPTAKAFVSNYLFNLSVGGLFIKTDAPLKPGEKMYLKVFLPDREDALEVLAEVMWSHEEEKEMEGKKFPPGMGVKFLNLSTDNIKRIISVFSQL